MTPRELLRSTSEDFSRCGVPDPLNDASWILSHICGRSPLSLRLDDRTELDSSVLIAFRAMAARRARREPLQYILGETPFCGLSFLTDPRALIPRPETEMLVDMAKERLKGINAPYIVEVGTGTAAISIACAKEIAGAKVLATDISEDALSLARENAEANALGEALTFAQGDLLDAVTGDTKIDCLIANLPYIPDGEKGKLQPEVDKFDPALALYGGPDGLSLVRKLLQQTEGKLNENAPILLEIGSEQAEILKNEAANYPWLEFTGIHKDYCGNIRFVSYKTAHA